MVSPGRKPPSRARYEATHPTLSFRLPQELAQELRERLSDSGLSFGDFVRVALDTGPFPELEAKLDEVRGKGYQQAKAEFAVTFHCCECGGIVEVTSAKGKAAAREYFEDHRWGHGPCLK